MTIALIGQAAVETLRVSIPTAWEGVLGRSDRQRCNARIDSWSRRLVDQAGIEITASGLEHYRRDETFVVMSNHQSLYDIPVLYQALRCPMRMVAKKELFRIPVFGPAMAAAEFIEVDRSNRRKALAAMARAELLVRGGVSIWIAPEGTRSKDGTLGVFKRGGFHLALGTGARILPVAVAGTMHVLPAKSTHIQRGVHVTVSVCPPIDPAAYGRRRLDELVSAVRIPIAAALQG